MDPILEVAQCYGLTVIEDACEALGAEYKGRRIGTQHETRNTKHATVFAFYPNKQITTGEGGMIVTDNDDWANLFRSLRNQGRDVHDAWLNHTRLGYNYRLDEMSAALGLAEGSTGAGVQRSRGAGKHSPPHPRTSAPPHNRSHHHSHVLVRLCHPPGPVE